ncbi:winged helix-turn-helix transcriptional regulator [Deinococcus sp. Arct2-2]|uniref:ArsR/SmtB family transcription factor n=1 Tax=Deinococcus sp. Arct2-2 TaxID=2568653 RepID=UPI0010A3A221|nr:metalloregulator ArsR/SmtB family transcription factor [Deinococcus sp. Arct2-2]THF71772.1 winged helix-turn-helix transcriptional regulator [Deinococcus sp. Arct2-2]
MARSPTTSDVFNAVAEAQRRQILTVLAAGELSVNALATTLNLRQPAVSKHLAVLKEVELVQVRGVGQQRLYSLNAAALKPIYDWAATFQTLWTGRLDRLEEHLADLLAQQKGDTP